MTTQKDELAEKTKEKIIELFGPESALAQAMEDDAFFDKLGSLIAWLYGEIMLSQPRPEPQPRTPQYPPPWPPMPTTRPSGIPWTEWKGTNWQSSNSAGDFTTKVTSAMAKYWG